jgi:two-component system chemotaxis response regulator CheY
LQVARALIVDDAPLIRQTLRAMLTELGLSVVGEAVDGEEALRLLQEHQPDLITMDLVLPKCDGMQTLRRIREHNPLVKVVIITAVDRRESIMEAFQLGAVDYVVKPFERERLEETIQRVVQA